MGGRWSPDGQYYAIGGNDGLLRIYTAEGFKLYKTYKFATAVQCLDWDKNGKNLAIALDDKPVQLLNIGSGKFSILKGISGSRALAWNCSSTMLAAGGYNGLLCIWDKEGKLLKTIKKEIQKLIYVSIGILKKISLPRQVIK